MFRRRLPARPQPARTLPRRPVSVAAGVEGLEIKDPQTVFGRVVGALEAEAGSLAFPKEILFLCGAPGAGKGAISPFVQAERGLAGTVVVSDLLTSPQAEALKAQGLMLPDREVVYRLLRELLRPEYRQGVIVDGFPRTRVQAQCIVHLYDHMLALQRTHTNTALEALFPRPRFRSVVLFVDERTSIERQMLRAQKAALHNRIVADSRVGGALEVRATDTSEEAARKRYAFFKNYTYESLLELKDKFHFHFIDASGPIEEVQKAVARELRYQSTMELSEATYANIIKVPLAEEVIRYARQDLVHRLDGYQDDHPDLFIKSINLINTEFMHIIRRQALAGEAVVRTENELLNNPLCLNMVLDILAERGYHVVLDYERRYIPTMVDRETFEIRTTNKKIFHFIIKFTKPTIRNVFQ